MEKLDLLAFGAHPDDIEIGMGGTLAKYADAGVRVGICNLTKAELSSNGTTQLRQEEAALASKKLGVCKRIQLDIRDRGLKYITEQQLSEIVSIIRRYQPDILFAPFEVDRHPDHGECSRIIKEAYFNAGIHRYQCSEKRNAYRPSNLFYYFINGYEHPDFVIDISEYIEIKREALQSYKSQFSMNRQSVHTPLTNDYINTVEAKDQLFGKEVGVKAAEGFKTSKPLIVEQLLSGRGIL
ncbi:bacillithiol biosynthesis deacetylase BshB1 [Bacillus sp. JCM 19034]|uniref:bacillithiol biosynthesis deacetylase BshB1 n=1 Tax=Bacillus sp. JCM 19034 TaxID=1481928 RepID=UPI0009E8358D|nr:bacillithiol biosynthesis deacetylase BshB1 [Bacillus sp. JCM 19034]